MKRMCLVMLTALVIIICVIAFQTLRESKEEVYDGVLIEKNTNWNDRDLLYVTEKKENGGIL